MDPGSVHWTKMGGYLQESEGPEYTSRMDRPTEATMVRTHGPQGKHTRQMDHLDREPKEKGKYAGTIAQPA